MFRTFDTAPTQTRDARVLDSTGAFLQGELERLDQTLHMPIAAVTWGRDVDIRDDVTIADETSSFANMTFASPGGVAPTGKAWIGPTTTAITGIQADVSKTVNPLNLWGMELGYTIPELESSIKVNRPIDSTKHDGLKLKFNMDVDEQVYVGDAPLGIFGLTNSPLVPATNAAPTGSNGSSTWANKTPQQILADVNAVLTAAWAATGYAFVPTKILIPPLQFGLIVQQVNTLAGNNSILEYLRKNSLASAQNGRDLEIAPLKWLTGRGVGGLDRMVAYTQDKSRVRIPLTPLLNTPVQYRGIHYLSYYYARIGVVEFTNTEFVYYLDGI
jgi:hypothetical protein